MRNRVLLDALDSTANRLGNGDIPDLLRAAATEIRALKKALVQKDISPFLGTVLEEALPGHKVYEPFDGYDLRLEFERQRYLFTWINGRFMVEKVAGGLLCGDADAAAVDQAVNTALTRFQNLGDAHA